MISPVMWLVAYDISQDGRRQRVANALARHGDRVQRSVFIIRLPRDATPLVTELEGLIDPRTDALHLIRICQSCQAEVIELGQALVPPHEECWVVL